MMPQTTEIESVRAAIIGARKLSTLARRLKVSKGMVSRVLAGQVKSARIQKAAISFAVRLQAKGATK